LINQSGAVFQKYGGIGRTRHVNMWGNFS
jgi:hypothetical protein